jgi:hypothetical protein
MRHTRFASLAILVLAFSTTLLPLMMFAPIARAASILYNSGDPTPDEQLVLEYINRARANPIAEGQRLGIDIHEGLSDPTLVGARPPLAMNPILLDTATAHTLDMYNHNYFSHNDPNGTTPFDRMTHAGYNYAMAGENMAGGVDMTSSQLEDFMMVDSGTPGRPHRVNLLDIFPYPCGAPPCIYSEVGIGYLNAPTPDGQGLSSLITEDFGATGYTGPFLLGVVYNDQNGNNFYDIGEGISGVTITPNTGTYYAISSTSGGYAIPIGSSGTITVTASGPGFGPITKTVTLTGTNIKLDFTTSSQTITTTSTSIQTTSTLATTSPSQTATSILNVPSIRINPISATTGSIIDITGSGFSTADVTCSLSGKAVGTSTCAISNGIVTASFIVANVPAGPYTITASGIEAGDSASSTFTVSAILTQTTTSRSTYTNETLNSTTNSTTYPTTTITQSSTNSTTTKTADFLLISSAPTITMTQGGSGSATITIYSLNGFSSTVALTSSWIGTVPAGVLVSITSPVTPVSGGPATIPLIVTANVTATPGAYVIQVAGISTSQSHIVTVNIIVQAFQPVSTSSTTITSATSATSMTSMTSTSLALPANCPVSYAVSGSELAPLAEELRAFRDHSITKTRSGLAFMILFNSWYYSLTPHLTSYLRLHPAQRELLRYVLYPLIAILYVSRYAYLLVSPVSVEGGAMTAGIIAASLLGLVYFAPIAYVVIRVIRRYIKFSAALSKTSMPLWCSISAPIVGAAYFMTRQLLGIAIANLLLSMLTLCAILGIQALSHLQLKCNSLLRTSGIATFAVSASDVLVDTLRHCT